ncbi:GNAT family N-acetyltransferase [Chengkuizengella sediminis]|uniref:GNAT family N-acetyltransferase n=1 Tax=Chengkuizengella sediminis TaxID=1885917 RepID=UPI00138A5EA8|nr:GNAT family N-acetyltransferase [Chengkuizengella sediminis]NDI34280.1 GNAT family N-acetyltransferase [Chengkuizengella sediminis]
MLSQLKLTQIKELQEICEKEEPISLKLNWDILRTRKEQEKRDFFYEKNGRLIGFLGLYLFGTKVEVCGMVHPEHRNKGIFSTLLQEALTACAREEVSSILLNAPAPSISGKYFLQNPLYSYRFSEYQMKWKETSLSHSPDVMLRKARIEDQQLEVELDVQCFDFNQDEAKIFNERIKGEENRSFYMIDYGGQTVGKITLDHANDETWIYGFAILPEHQGRGIGRKTLINTVLAEQEKGYSIFLEVEVSNKNALKLYTDCGFQSYGVQDYYEIRLEE